MKQRQYPSYNAAVADLDTLGDLVFHGTLSAQHDHYTLTIGGRIYRLFVYQSGLVEWREELDGR